MSIRKICITGVFTALVCMSTLIFKIPIPGGYAHIGNGFIFIGACVIGNTGGMLAAGLGSVLADLLGGWYVWIIPTFIIKSIMGLLVAFIAPGKIDMKSPRTAMAVIFGAVEMVMGYFLAGKFVMGTWAASATQLIGLISEALVGILIFYIVGFALEKGKMIRME